MSSYLYFPLEQESGQLYWRINITHNTCFISEFITNLTRYPSHVIILITINN